MRKLKNQDTHTLFIRHFYVYVRQYNGVQQGSLAFVKFFLAKITVAFCKPLDGLPSMFTFKLERAYLNTRNQTHETKTKSIRDQVGELSSLLAWQLIDNA
jgi:hypothetical protein